MGQSSSKDSTGQRPVVLDLSGPLTAEEKKAIKLCWSKISENYASNGVGLFLEFFKKYPECKEVFHDFAAMSLEKLTTSPRLSAHALAVFYFLQAVIDNIDDEVLVEALIRKNGLSHSRRKGVTTQQFVYLTNVMKDYFHQLVGDKLMTPVAMCGWEKLLNTVLSCNEKAFEEARRKK
ncbi:globin-like [Ornithodoros turicata]|uniref:globin-like n=1 Tax=Ornithodoros turicata TaxID=34597 RepID=UPI00313A44EC